MEYAEIHRLREMLDKENIPYEFNTLYDGFHLCYPRMNKTKDDHSRVCSVIEHDFSYGSHKDLLEIMGLLTDEEAKYDEVVGYLTAEDVFARIKKHYDEVK